MVIFLAGLQDISPELYEAAELDGASAWQRFRHVTLPGLRPVMVFVLTITILASANVFGQPYLITQGQPGRGDPHAPSCRSVRRACASSRWAAPRR